MPRALLSRLLAGNPIAIGTIPAGATLSGTLTPARTPTASRAFDTLSINRAQPPSYTLVATSVT